MVKVFKACIPPTAAFPGPLNCARSRVLSKYLRPLQEAGLFQQNLILILNHNENQGEFSSKAQGLRAPPHFPEIIPSKETTSGILEFADALC